MAETTAQLQQKLKALTNGKVDIMLNADEFKSTTQILREMADVWQEMTDVQQAAALELLGGKRQANILSSVITNFQTVEDVIQTSMESSGSAIAENEKYLDSIQGRLDLFSNSLQKFWSNLIDSETVKTAVDAGTSIINLLDTTHGKVIALVAAVKLMAKFKGFSLKGIGTSLVDSIKQISIAQQSLATLTSNPATKFGQGYDITNINLYAAAVSNLTAKQQANMLASAGLSKAQIQLALQYNGLSEDAVREATAHIFAKQAKDQEKLSDQQLLTNKILLSAASLKLAGDTDSLAAAEFLEANAAKYATAEELKAAIVKDAELTPAAKAAALATVGQASANIKLGASFKALFASNPVGMILTIATTILTVAIPAFNYFGKSAKRLKEEVKELTDTYEEAKQSFSDNLKTLTASSDVNTYATLEEEFKQLTKGVDAYGNNISLTADQYERYRQICETICDINPSLKAGYDSVTEAIGNNASVLSNLIELQKIQARQTAQEYVTDENIEKIFKDKKNDLKKAQEKIYAYLEYNGADGITGISQLLFQEFDWNDVGTKDYGDKSSNADDLAKKILETIGLSDVDDKLKEYYNEHGYFQWSQFTKAYADTIAENAKVFKSEAISNWAVNWKSAQRDLENAQNNMISTFLQIPFSLDEYDKLQNSSKSFITDWIKNSGLFTIDENTTQEEILTLKSKIRDFVEQIANNNYSVALDNGSVITASDILDSIYNFDAANVDWKKYKAEIQNLINLLWQSIGAENNTLGFDDKNSLALSLGFDIQIAEDQEEKMKARYKEITGKTDDEIEAYFDSLPATTVQRLLKVDWNLVDENNLDDTISPNSATQIVSSQSYSALADSAAKYNEIITTLNELTYDNIEITQEQYDVLKELIGSEEEFADCIDDSNGYIVKNTKLLNNLVKSSKKNAASNVKLAKSQAKLQYYELYKEMKKLVNGQKVTDAVTLDYINTLYSQMGALEKTIAKYSLLEAKLLGTTSAYEELAAAQEADEISDYGTKAEDLVNVLATAFNTAELGTEAAQVAFKGLIPDDVIDKAKTLDEQMAQAYKYFTKGTISKLFKIEFDGDGAISSVEMTKEKVEEFTKSLIGSAEEGAVFQGTWDEFTLNPAIKTLEQFADAIDTTKEVAFAYLTQLERYDINWLGRDFSTLLDQLIPTSDSIKAFGEQMQNEFDKTPIDLTIRPKVNWEKMQEAGWDVPEGSYSTVNTVTYTASELGLLGENENDYAINVTPILPDGTVIQNGDDGLRKYIIGKVKNGESLEDLDVYLGSYESIEKAVEAAERLHEMQETYYDMVSNYSLENDIYGTMQKLSDLEMKIANGTMTDEDQKMYGTLINDMEGLEELALKNATGWAEANSALEDTKSEMIELNKQLADTEEGSEAYKEIQEKIEDAQREANKLIQDMEAFGEPTEFVLTVAADEAQEQIDEFKNNLNELVQSGNKNAINIQAVIDKVDDSGIEGLGLTRNPDGTWSGLANIEGYSSLDEESKAKVVEYLNLIDGKHTIDALMGDGITTVEQHLKDIVDILQKTYELQVQANVDKSNVTSFIDWLKNTPISKTVSFYANKIGDWLGLGGDKGKDSGGGSTSGGFANGTAHVAGTAYRQGSWGAPKTETALVGELGPELLVRGNRWTTIGENGAEFTQVKKGDIIFNHEQARDLLSKGYVTGRGKAYASGTAYAGINTWDTAYGKVHKDYSGKGSGKSSADDAKDEFEELFDWIEVRLEEINKQLDFKNARLDNSVGFAKQNKVIEEMLDLNEKLYDNLIAGANKYYEYAGTLLAKIPTEYRKAAQDGSIAIETFIGEVDEETYNAIQDFREWVQKGDDAVQQAEEVITEVSSLAKQAIDNIATDFGNKNSIRDNIIDQLDAYNALVETKYGSESDKIYQAIIKETNDNIKTLQTQRDKMQAELNKQVEAGNIQKYSQDWYDAVNDIAAVDTEIINLTVDTYDYQDSINELHWDAFDNLLGRLEAISDEANNLIDILGSKDLVDETGNWTNEGITSLGLYAQKMEVAEMQVKKYADEIDYLNKNWKKLGYAEQEYVEKLEELKEGQYDAIKAYNDTKDAIVDLNKERVDAIKNGIEKEISAYEKLINKKKEELDAEKDLYDFQKGVQEQQKDIADIRRKIAALAGDNSAAARAQRAKLQAEFAEAQANLEETYYDRSITNQQDALDKELENFKDTKDKEIENWDEYLEKTEQVVADSLSVIQANTDAIYQTMQEMGQEYSLSITESLTSPWQDGAIAVQDFSEKFGLSMSSTVEELQKVADKYKKVMDEISNYGDQVVEKANDNASKYQEANNPSKPKFDSPENVVKQPTVSGNGSSSHAGMVSGISAVLRQGSTGADVKKLQQALNDLGFNAGVVDGKFGPNTKQAVIRFQGSSKYGGAISADGIVGPNTKKKFKTAGYAKGSKGVDKDQLAIIEELGDELQLVPDGNGRLAYIKKGTGILTHTMTERLMDIAMNPQDMLDRNRPTIGAPHITNNEISVNMNIAEVIHIDEVTNDTIPDLTKAVQKQMDSYMAKVNNSLKRYTRG